MSRYESSDCHGKDAFADRPLADAVLRRMQHGRARGALNVYRCRWCRAWHIGRAKPADSRPAPRGRQKSAVLNVGRPRA